MNVSNQSEVEKHRENSSKMTTGGEIGEVELGKYTKQAYPFIKAPSTKYMPMALVLSLNSPWYLHRN